MSEGYEILTISQDLSRELTPGDHFCMAQISARVMEASLSAFGFSVGPVLHRRIVSMTGSGLVEGDRPFCLDFSASARCLHPFLVLHFVLPLAVTRRMRLVSC